MIVYREHSAAPRESRLEPAYTVQLGEIGFTDLSVAFDCPCGEPLLIEDEPAPCPGCGRTYRLHAFVTVEEPTL